MKETIGTRLGDINDLPKELKTELRIKPANMWVENINRYFDGIITLTEALVFHYRKTGEIYTRKQMNNTFANLVKHNLVRPIKGKKGVFITTEYKGELQ